MTSVDLLLDLDGTVFLCMQSPSAVTEWQMRTQHAGSLHPSQSLSTIHCQAPLYFSVINPKRLKALIEQVYALDCNIVLFTAGTWPKSVKAMIASLCELTEAARVRFTNSVFLNAATDAKLLDLDKDVVAHMKKSHRLHGLISHYPELRGRHFVLLDDNPFHVDSCRDVAYMTGVLAKTSQPGYMFYQTVLEKLTVISAVPNLAVSPKKPHSYHYPERVLTGYMAAIKQSNAIAESDDSLDLSP